MANPARGLLNREKKKKKKSGSDAGIQKIEQGALMSLDSRCTSIRGRRDQDYNNTLLKGLKFIVIITIKGVYNMS